MFSNNKLIEIIDIMVGWIFNHSLTYNFMTITDSMGFYHINLLDSSF